MKMQKADRERQEDKLPSAREMAELDRLTIAAGTPSRQLMEKAGQAVFERICSHEIDQAAGQLLILCGNGNNGGDGFVVARHLLAENMAHRLVVCSSSKYSPDLVCQAQSYASAGGEIFIFPDSNSKPDFPVREISRSSLIEEIKSSKAVLDALLGTGQTSAPRGAVREMAGIVSQIHENCPGRFKIIAVDTPTGIDCDSGESFSPCLRADATVSIQLLKRGMLQYPAREICGRLSRVAIGIDTSPEIEFRINSAESLKLPAPRQAWAHKGSFGRVLAIAGSRNLPGAGILSASAALRSGAGLVTLAAFTSSRPAGRPELMYACLEDQGRGCFTAEMTDQLLKLSENADALIVGPGMGQEHTTVDFLLRFLPACKKPAVVDADALNILSSAVDKPEQLVRFLPKDCVLTPHPGEMARLLKTTVTRIQQDRYSAARNLSNSSSATVVLKGAASIIYSASCGFVNQTGNPFMATAGSGDVLSGIIASLLAQGFSPCQAARTGTYIHGLAGDIASAQAGGLIIAGDITDAVPKAFSSLTAAESGLPC